MYMLPSSLTFNPFHEIDTVLRNRAILQTDNSQSEITPHEPENDPVLNAEMECRYFQETMEKEGVKPTERCRRASIRAERSPAAPCPFPDEAAEILLQLRQLVEIGEGFHVDGTPEYMEGTGCGIPPSYAWRLHRGDFSIRAHIDLHGMNAKEAVAAVESFLKESVAAGKRAVLIVHGRGLSSRDEPVLKNRVRALLTSRTWKKWIIAFSSARSFDGGAGATYVLLREYPFSKKPGKRPTN